MNAVILCPRVAIVKSQKKGVSFPSLPIVYLGRTMGKPVRFLVAISSLDNIAYSEKSFSKQYAEQLVGM